MKLLSHTYRTLCIIFSLGLASQLAFAHSDHSHINADQAKAIALSMTKKLSLKDLGYSVGKLDKSWRSATAGNTQAVSSEAGQHIIEVNNPENDSTIVLTISSSGDVITVKTK